MPLHPVSDAFPVVFDQNDPTRLIRLDAGGVGAGQTRVLAMPDADVDLGDVLGLGSAKGLVARDRAGGFAARRIVAGSQKVYVSEGDGETGNPTIDVITPNIVVAKYRQLWLPFTLEDPVAGRAYKIGGGPNAATIKWVVFRTMSGSLTFNLEKRAVTTPETTGTKVWTSDKTANTTSAASPVTTFDSAAIAQYQALFLVIVSVTSSGTFYLDVIPEIDT